RAVHAAIGVAFYRIWNYYRHFFMVLWRIGRRLRAAESHASGVVVIHHWNGWICWPRHAKARLSHDADYICDPWIRVSTVCLFFFGMDYLSHTAEQTRARRGVVLVCVYRWA